MKILIATEVVAGNGHHRAAESILKAIKQEYPQHDVKIVHILELVYPLVEKLIEKVYMTMILRIPKLWGWMYQRESNFAFLFKQVIAYTMFIKLNHFLKKEKPDLIIATHASGLTALSKLKKKNQYKIAAVFTDYHFNRFWIHSYIDYYFVGHEELKEKMIRKYKLDPNSIHVSGIPIDPIFSQITAIQAGSTEASSFRVLVMGGGLGLGSIVEIVHSLTKLQSVPFTVTVIAGRNEKLFNKLIMIKSSLPFPLEVLPYVKDIYHVMRKSDLIITKPGGLTTSEALSTLTPILIFDPIPGQEENNARFLVRKHVAIRIDHLNRIPYWVEYLYHHPVLRNKIREHQTKVSKPDSSVMIARNLLN